MGGAPGRLAARYIALATLAWAVVGVSPASAQVCLVEVGQVVAAEGEVEARGAGEEAWRPLASGAPLCREDTVRTGKLSRAALALVNESVLRLDAETTLRLADVAVEEQGRSILDLVFGAFQSFSRRPREVDVNTPHMVLAIRGTEFTARTAAEESLLAVQEGTVRASNPEGELVVASGQSAIARPGEAPQPYLLVTPRDAVQWALYYPPILAVGTLADPEAMRLAEAGDVAGALDVLGGLPNAESDPQVQTQRAALLLSVGQVDAARAAIDRALAADPNAGLAYALRAVIEVAQNRNEEALASARRGVELSPSSAAAWTALSYAQQALFDLNGALDSMQRATEAEPENALAWARLAEVRQMQGDRRGAREAAGKAEQLSPELARTQSVLGFADLAEIRIAPARAAFERAVELNPGDPLPRFGLGLAQIRAGRLEEGRRNIELAVGLDPANALLRTYLGKAYFEEKRDDLAGEQFDMAKQLDPLDPTAYLYDAIRKQTLNRPVEALRDLERSIELNDNRIVYRSRFQLDTDRAARGTSLARIYDDLGFQELGVVEASRSLTTDPANTGAHRFLSDIYRDVRRREVASVSELLQAQLLQDLNINPVQPRLSETNLNIVTQGGPADVGFNEFTPLFERNRMQLNAAGIVGNNDTLGGEAVVSALYDQFSISAGAFDFDTDGWRDNHDISHKIYDVFFQTALTPELNAQFEFRRRETRFGDLDFNFDRDDFDPNERNSLDLNIVRGGLRYSPAQHSDLILSYIYSDRDRTIDELFPLGVPGLNVNQTAEGDSNGHQLDLQYIFRQERLNLIAGGGLTRLDGDEQTLFEVQPCPFPDTPEFCQASLSGNTETRYRHGYIYGNLNVPRPVTWTLGISYDDFEFDAAASNTVEKVNPKAGVQWQVTDDLTLRAAAFRVMKPPLTANQTIEPTQIAGFNQLYDDPNGTVSTRYGIGLDHRLMQGLYLGGETTWRSLDISALGNESFDADEQTHRLYLNWTPFDQLALSAELVYDRWQTSQSLLTTGETPEDVTTWSVPLTARYFHPSGMFATFGGAFVNQDVKRTQGTGLADGSDSFVVLDAAIGYRFPKRLGTVSLQVNNILDEGFNYQDDSYREVEDAPSIGPYIPERSILFQVTLNW
jgi:tetratricopeptide (TPR) repeat protein